MMAARSDDGRRMLHSQLLLTMCRTGVGASAVGTCLLCAV